MPTTGQDGDGPSPRMFAWRLFIMETVLCVVLVAAIVAIALEARHDLLAGPAIIALAGVIVKILRGASSRS